MLRMGFRRGVMPVAALLVAAAIAGCYRPEGNLFSKTLGPQTFWSTELSPKTVTIVDNRSEEVIFAMDIPANQQLVIDFDEGQGDDPGRSPDRMRWALMPRGKTTGSLSNQQSVPPLRSLRIDVSIREAPEYAPPPDTAAYRTDTPEDRPAWWTTEGGPLPEENAALTNYDN